MSPIFAFHILAILGSLTLGAVVYLTNPRRTISQCYMVLSTVLGAWLICLALAFTLKAPAAIAFSIRGACAFGITIPICFEWLRHCITQPDRSWRQILTLSRTWTLASAVVALLCTTPFFLRGVIISPTQGEIPEPVYGPFFLVYAVFFVVGLVILFWRLILDVRRYTGIRRAELQFVLLASWIGLFLSVLFTVVAPIVTGSSQTAQLAGVAAVIFHSIIAYGIATRRILEVAYVLRRLTATSLLAGYLVALYAAVWYASRAVVGIAAVSAGTAATAAHLLSAVAVAFSMTPAHGLMQRFANRLFVNMSATNVAQTVTRATTILQSLGTLDTILEQFSQVIAESVGTDRVVILMKNVDTYTQVHPSSLGGSVGAEHPPPGSGSEPPLVLGESDPVAAQLKDAKEPLVLDLIQRMSPSEGLDALAKRLKELHMATAVAIRFKGELRGIMLVGPRLSGRIYGQPEQDALQGACDQLAVAVENSSLYTEIQNSKIYNEILLDSLVSGVIAANADRMITVCNQEAQRITRLTSEQLLGKPIDVLPRPLVRILAETLETGLGVRNSDLTIRHGPNDDVPVQLGSDVFHGQDGQGLGALIVFSDLTLVKRLESQVRRTAHLASLGTLSAGMAHEIKNPLVTLRTFSHLLPERYGDADFRETFSMLVEKEVKRIDDIVNQLLKFGRPAKATLMPAHLGTIIEQCIELVKAPVHQKGIQVVTDLATTNDLIRGDAKLLGQAFVNFFLNAVDAMERGGVLAIRMFDSSAPTAADEVWKDLLPSRHVSVTVRDSGQGIRPEHLGKIFDPFFTTKSTGTGLGLSVVHGIMQEHNAMIDVESTVGEGTTFHIVFPLIDEPHGSGALQAEHGNGTDLA